MIELNGIHAFGDTLQSVMDQIEYGSSGNRHRVIRTKSTEGRRPIDPHLRKVVYARDNFRCVWCGRDRKWGDRHRLVLDHIKPWSAGGSDDYDNLRTLCWTCNEERSNFCTPDDGWRPLPVTHYCVRCHADLRREFPDDEEYRRPFPSGQSNVGAAFCTWHLVATIGYLRMAAIHA